MLAAVLAIAGGPWGGPGPTYPGSHVEVASFGAEVRAEDGRGKVIYLRHDGDYGLVEHR